MPDTASGRRFRDEMGRLNAGRPRGPRTCSGASPAGWPAGERAAPGVRHAHDPAGEGADRRPAYRRPGDGPRALVGLRSPSSSSPALCSTARPCWSRRSSSAALALLTRGILHLDGLADTADGLGPAARRRGALEVMRRTDIGPFGVVTLVLTLLSRWSRSQSCYAAGASARRWRGPGRQRAEPCRWPALARRPARTGRPRRHGGRVSVPPLRRPSDAGGGRAGRGRRRASSRSGRAARRPARWSGGRPPRGTPVRRRDR